MQVVYITAPNLASAEMLATILVESKLVACVNLFDNVKSIYPWQGNIEKSNEVVLIAKTIHSKVSDVISTVQELHEYSCPCIFLLMYRASLVLSWIGLLGCSQAVRQRFLIPSCEGSNPSIPAIIFFLY